MGHVVTLLRVALDIADGLGMSPGRRAALPRLTPTGQPDRDEGERLYVQHARARTIDRARGSHSRHGQGHATAQEDR